MANDNAQLLLAKSDRLFIYQNKNFLKYISLFFLFFGVLVRLVQYINNRSLWDDEASIALNIVNRSYLELAFPLDHNQVAPPGFLWIEKLSIDLLGNHEYALRLFPLIAGIISLFVFYLLANRYISAFAIPIAIALLSCLKYILYYATEVKQYSIDVMVSLLLCLILIPLWERILTKRQIFFLSVLGAIFIWLSHPAIFMLSGLELSTLLSNRGRKRQSVFFNRLPIYFVWALSFGLLYLLTLNGSMQNETLQDSWGGGYPNFSLDVVWFFDSLGRFFYKPLGFYSLTDGVAIVAFICGCIAYYRSNKTLLFFLSPFLTTFIASYLKKYPFRDRLLLFLTPLAILLIAEGVSFFLTRSHFRLKIVGMIMAISLVVPPAIATSQLVLHPQLKEEIRPVLEYVKSHQKPGESFYIYTRARSAFTYYAEKYGYSKGEYILGDRILPIDQETKDEENFYHQEVEKLRGKRVWLLYRGDEEKQPEILSYLNPLGRQLDFFSQPGIFVYLYDMRSPLHDNNLNQ